MHPLGHAQRRPVRPARRSWPSEHLASAGATWRSLARWCRVAHAPELQDPCGGEFTGSVAPFAPRDHGAVASLDDGRGFQHCFDLLGCETAPSFAFSRARGRRCTRVSLGLLIVRIETVPNPAQSPLTWHVPRL